MQDKQVASNRAGCDARAPYAFAEGADGFSEADPGPGMVAGERGAVRDTLPGVVSFIKGTEGRYTHANLTQVHRLGLTRRDDVIGRNEFELYPDALGGSHAEQDERVLLGETVENELQLQVLPNHAPGGCLIHKRPLRVRGEIRGIVGSSHDIAAPDATPPCLASLQRVFDYLHEHYGESVRVYALAAMVGMSMAQLDRHFRSEYRLTPQQMLTKLRIESAMRLLRGCDSMAAISQACGFADQSAFTRQFKATVGMTPRSYRSSVAAAANSGLFSRRPPAPHQAGNRDPRHADEAVSGQRAADGPGSTMRP
jgi:AraC-like DNA-binding protein